MFDVEYRGLAINGKGEQVQRWVVSKGDDRETVEIDNSFIQTNPSSHFHIKDKLKEAMRKINGKHVLETKEGQNAVHPGPTSGPGE